MKRGVSDTEASGPSVNAHGCTGAHDHLSRSAVAFDRTPEMSTPSLHGDIVVPMELKYMIMKTTDKFPTKKETLPKLKVITCNSGASKLHVTSYEITACAYRLVAWQPRR